MCNGIGFPHSVIWRSASIIRFLKVQEGVLPPEGPGPSKVPTTSLPNPGGSTMTQGERVAAPNTLSFQSSRGANHTIPIEVKRKRKLHTFNVRGRPESSVLGEVLVLLQKMFKYLKRYQNKSLNYRGILRAVVVKLR